MEPTAGPDECPARLGANDEFRALLDRAKRGDRDAAGALLRRHADRVRLVARRSLSPALRRLYDSIDVTQSVAREILRGLPRIEDRGETSFRRLLETVARTKAREKARRLRRGGVRAEREPVGPPELAVDPGPPPPEAADRAESTGRVAAAVNALEATTREVVVRRARHGDDFASIAFALGLPSADAARKRYARGLVELRELLEGGSTGGARRLGGSTERVRVTGPTARAPRGARACRASTTRR